MVELDLTIDTGILSESSAPNAVLIFLGRNDIFMIDTFFFVEPVQNCESLSKIIYNPKPKTSIVLPQKVIRV